MNSSRYSPACIECLRSAVPRQDCRTCEYLRALQYGKCKICGKGFFRGDRRPEICGAAECRLEQLRRGIPNRLVMSGVPPRYQGCRFENFDTPPELREKLEIVRKMARRKLARGIFLFGPIGCGKTHIAISVLVEQLMRVANGQFVRSMDFASRCRSAFRPGNDTTVDFIVGELLSSNVLIFDDLGADKSSDFLRESLLNLFDSAYCEQKPLIVTSNLRIEQINEIEPRLASRISEMCLPVEMTGQDFRIRKANEALKVSRSSEFAESTEPATVEGR